MATREFTSSAPAPAQPAAPQSASPAKPAPATRRVRVSSLSRDVQRGEVIHNLLPMSYPFLRLSGRWLEQAGFDIGADVQVSVAHRRLVLEVVGEGKPPCNPFPKRSAC